MTSCETASSVMRIVNLETFVTRGESYPIDSLCIHYGGKRFSVDVDGLIAWMVENGFAEEVER